MSAGLVKSILDANRLLRFCKENADVGDTFNLNYNKRTCKEAQEDRGRDHG